MAAKSITAVSTPFKRGRRVQTVASPHRKGIVAAVTGSGVNAVVTVNFPGWHPAQLRPAQLTLL